MDLKTLPRQIMLTTNMLKSCTLNNDDDIKMKIPLTKQSYMNLLDSLEQKRKMKQELVTEYLGQIPDLSNIVFKFIPTSKSLLTFKRSWEPITFDINDNIENYIDEYGETYDAVTVITNWYHHNEYHEKILIELSKCDKILDVFKDEQGNIYFFNILDDDEIMYSNIEDMFESSESDEESDGQPESLLSLHRMRYPERYNRIFLKPHYLHYFLKDDVSSVLQKHFENVYILGKEPRDMQSLIAYLQQ